MDGWREGRKYPPPIYPYRLHPFPPSDVRGGLPKKGIASSARSDTRRHIKKEEGSPSRDRTHRHIHNQTRRQTDGRTDGQADGRTEQQARRADCGRPKAQTKKKKIRGRGSHVDDEQHERTAREACAPQPSTSVQKNPRVKAKNDGLRQSYANDAATPSPPQPPPTLRTPHIIRTFRARRQTPTTPVAPHGPTHSSPSAQAHAHRARRGRRGAILASTAPRV
jgi:hypothetical protein